MATIKDFLKRHGNKKLSEVPFCEADIAALNLLSYCDFSKVNNFDEIAKDKFVNLFDFFNEKNIYKTLSDQYNNVGNNFKEFVKLFLKSNRYKNLKIGYIKKEFDLKKMAQFYALSYKLYSNKIICFRGTDNTVNGFKEDMNIAYLKEIPAQKLSLEYANKMIDVFKKDIIITGQSKGGNLAYFSYFNLPLKKKELIKKIYNIDGPGFKDDPYSYEEFNKKIFKFVSYDDVVGIFFDNSNNMIPVESTCISLKSHDLLSWCFDEKKDLRKFKRAKRLTVFSRSLRKSFHNWVITLKEDEIKDFLDFTFDVAGTMDAFTVQTLLKTFILDFRKYKKTVNNYDKEKREEILAMSKKFVKIYLKNLKLNIEKR